ncbi:MAG: ABC transporter ATP-binding protein [Oligoflexia bacterium]|nr:ABC transporter ATP-binding protein [Oligoflexia bacterium]MBF0365379.1 ABC transporter ATP-binding protein [Oligoflexia bacterium]
MTFRNHYTLEKESKKNASSSVTRPSSVASSISSSFNSTSRPKSPLTTSTSVYKGPSHSKPFLDKGTLLYNLEELSVEFGKIAALRSINLKIGVKEKIFLTGPSGAGKSTLLKVLGGIIRPTRGKIIGPHLNNQKNRYISFIFQDLRLLNNWSIEENLHFAYDPALYSSASEFSSELKTLAKIFDLYDRLHYKVGDTNGGMKQKVAIIRALLTKPQILLADEPTSALDRESGLKLYEVLSNYNDRNEMTIIWASHNQELIKQLSGKVIQLNNGQLTYSGYSCFTS